MEIRPEMLAKLLSENDERLWELIRRVAVMNNITLPTKAPSSEEMARLREVLKSTSLSYDDAMKVLNNFKQGAGK